MTKSSWQRRALLVSTALLMPSFAYAQDTTEAGADDAEMASPDYGTSEPTYRAPEVSAPGEILVTGRRNRDVARSADQVVAVLSSEEIARTGEGDIAGALGRVTGLSVVGSGYVYVRGLGDRYSLALLNGLPLPSPEPLKRVVPLDIFPTSIVASSLVQKSYSVNYPGEFGGGVINLTTTAVPDESYLKIGAGFGGNSETTFETGYSYGGASTDWTGFDDGSRNAPSYLAAFLGSGEKIGSVDQTPIIKQLVHPTFALVQKMDHVPMDWSGSITGGTAFDICGSRMGIVASLSYSNEWRTRDITRDRPSSLDLTEKAYESRSIVTDNHITVNGLLGFGLEAGDHKFRFNNLFIRDTIKHTSFGIQNDTLGTDLFNTNNAWYERQLIDTQFVGELRFGNFGVDLRAGYANTQREAPFETTFEYFRSNNPNDLYGNLWVNNLDGNQGDASVAFSDLNEDLWYGGIDGSLLLTDRLTATAGYAYTDTYRKSARREFVIRAPAGPDTQIVGLLRPDLLVSPALIDFYNYSLIETTESDPAFAAGLTIHAGYLKANWEPLDAISLDIGARYESAEQMVRELQVFLNQGALERTTIKNDYWLPAATLTWQINPDLQFRLNASKTIARPQFREQIEQLYYDPETNRTYRGNADLVDSELFNTEARMEYYFGGGQHVSVAGFYKKIDNPIETTTSFSDNTPLTRFANAPKANLYGVEVEVQKNFDLYGWGGFFETRRLVTSGNYTWSKSKLKVDAGDFVTINGTVSPAEDVFVDGSPLTGQSDHIANLQLSLEDTEHLSQQTIMVTYASKRAVSRGGGGFGDVLEDPGIQVDFVVRQGIRLFGIDTEWKAEVRNIFAENHQEYLASGDNRVDLNTYDLGRKFSLSVSASF